MRKHYFLMNLKITDATLNFNNAILKDLCKIQNIQLKGITLMRGLSKTANKIANRHDKKRHSTKIQCLRKNIYFDRLAHDQVHQSKTCNSNRH